MREKTPNVAGVWTSRRYERGPLRGSLVESIGSRNRGHLRTSRLPKNRATVHFEINCNGRHVFPSPRIYWQPTEGDARAQRACREIAPPAQSRTRVGWIFADRTRNTIIRGDFGGEYVRGPFAAVPMKAREAGVHGWNCIGASVKTPYAGNRGVIVFADKNVRRESCLLVIFFFPTPRLAETSDGYARTRPIFAPGLCRDKRCAYAGVQICIFFLESVVRGNKTENASPFRDRITVS